MMEKSPVWRGHIQLSSSPPYSPTARGGAYTSRTSASSTESLSMYCRPPSKPATLQRVAGRFSHSATSSFSLRSSAFCRVRSSAPTGTAASISFVTSVKLRGTWMRAPLPGSSSSRLFARKPWVMRSFCGVLCSWMMPKTQWWLVMIRPDSEMKAPEQPPMFTVPASRPVPRLGSHNLLGDTWRPWAFSHAGSSSRTCWGVHFPSPASAGAATSERSRSVFFIVPPPYLVLAPLATVSGEGSPERGAHHLTPALVQGLTPASPAAGPGSARSLAEQPLGVRVEGPKCRPRAAQS